MAITSRKYIKTDDLDPDSFACGPNGLVANLSDAFAGPFNTTNISTYTNQSGNAELVWQGGTAAEPTLAWIVYPDGTKVRVESPQTVPTASATSNTTSAVEAEFTGLGQGWVCWTDLSGCSRRSLKCSDGSWQHATDAVFEYIAAPQTLFNQNASGGDYLVSGSFINPDPDALFTVATVRTQYATSGSSPGGYARITIAGYGIQANSPMLGGAGSDNVWNTVLLPPDFNWTTQVILAANALGGATTTNVSVVGYFKTKPC